MSVERLRGGNSVKRSNFGVVFYLVMVVLAGSPGGARPQGNFEVVTGKAFDSAMPKDFYLEGNAIPTEKRNAVLLKNPGGGRGLFALIDTSGYSSQIRQKYIGMLISEGRLSICGKAVSVGSYGFGLEKPSEPGDRDGKFFLFDQSGEKVAECAVKKDTQLQQPKPLQVVVGKAGSASLYLGRYKLELQ